MSNTIGWGRGVSNNSIGWGNVGTNGFGSIYTRSNSGETDLLSVDDTNFIIEVDTSIAGATNSDQFQFTGAVGEYDVEAYQNDSLVASFNDLVNEQTITLPSAGIYELRVIPKEAGFDKLRFNSGGDKDKLLKVLQWGLYGVNEFNQSRAFFGCTNNTEIADGGAWFDVVTIADFMFRGNSLTSLPAGMELPNLTIADFMFRGNSLTSLPAGMELPNLSDGVQMFVNNSLTSLPSGMELPLLTVGANMFDTNSLTSLPAGMVLPNLSNGREMFKDNSLTSLPAGIELPNLTNGGNMFLNNTINTERYSQLLIDLEEFNPNNNVPFHGGNSEYNVQGQIARNDLIARGWTFTDGGLAEEFYFNIEVDTSIAGASNSDQFQFTGAIGEYDVEAYQNDNLVASFSDLVNEQTITLPSSGIYELRVIPKEAGFDKLRFNNGGDKDKLLQVLQWGLYGVNEPDQSFAFYRCNLTQIPDAGAWFGVVTNGNSMFRSNFLTSLPSGMELPNINDGLNMFLSNSLTSLPSGMELPNLSNAGAMFHTNSLTSLPLGMELPNLTDGVLMFFGNTLNTTRYSQLLIDIEANNPNNNVAFHGGNSKYNAQGETARNLLISRGWTFTDGGLEI